MIQSDVFQENNLSKSINMKKCEMQSECLGPVYGIGQLITQSENPCIFKMIVLKEL